MRAGPRPEPNGRATSVDAMAGIHHRSHTIAAGLAPVLALALVACGSDDGDDTATDTAADETTATETDTTETGAGENGDESETAGGLCDGLDDADVAALTGEVVDTGPLGGEPTFGRTDGSEFEYASEGCTFDVAVEGDEDPHEYSLSLGTPPEGIDLFDEFVATRDTADLTPVPDLGEEAYVDATFGSQKIELIVRTGDGTALIVSSAPPFGSPVADQDTLVGLAELVL